MHNIILSHTISNYTINHIKSSNIIKWLTVIQTKWEREREQKEIQTDWESEETKKRIRVWENEDTRKEKNSKNKNLSKICI